MDTTGGDGLAGAPDSASDDEPAILEEIEVEDLAVDGICGVY
jgi:mycofactocin precursor